jgi:hypothetical protein
MEFQERFYAKLIDQAFQWRAFMEDINSGLNAVKKAIESAAPAC